MRKKSVKIRTTALGVTGTGVNFTYKLVKTNEVSIADLGIGHTPIDLTGDQSTTDPNTFESKSATQYMGLYETDGILVTVDASGKSGNNWSLTISVNGAPLTSNPIKSGNPDQHGHLDHNQKHQ